MWDKLRWRLKATAKKNENYHYGGSTRLGDRQLEEEPVYLITVKLFVRNGSLLAWYTPEKIKLEPRQFDVSRLTQNGVRDWPGVIKDLKIFSQNSTCVDKSLVIQDGVPMGWLDMT